MAGNGDIRQKIVLEGEREYSAALKEAQRNLKVLRSELKAETAELGKNATEQQKNETKTRNLQKQIKEQEKVVRTYEKALKEVREKYGDNEEAIAKWEVKLNDARTALGNMKSELDGVGNGFKKISSGAGSSIVEMNALGQCFERISGFASGMSDAIEGAFTGIVGTIKETIGAVWGELMDIAAKSDNYLDLASYFGASATEVQKWDRALRASHNDLSSITGMISRLKYGGKDDKITEWFGISGENYTNDLEYVEAVLGKMAEDKESMVAAGTWDDAMGDIFGAKKVQEIDSLLSDWDEIKRNLGVFDVDNGGEGMTEDELQTMADLYSQVGLLQERWNAFKESVATKIFGKLALDLTSNFQGALDALIAFMDADSEEEREKALEDFQKNIEEAFTKIGEAIQAAGEALDKAGEQLQGSENSYVRLLGKILSGISDAMEWITTEGNLEKVLNFFRAIFDLWLVGKGAEFISKITGVASSLGTIINYGKKWFDGGTNAATDAATNAASDAAGTAAKTAGKTAGKSGVVKDASITAASLAIPLAIGYEVTAGYQQSIDAWNADAERRKGEFARQEKSFTGESDPLMVDAWKYIQEHANDEGFLDDLAERYYKWYKSPNVTSEYYGYEDPLWDAIQQAYDSDYISPETYRALVGSGEDLQGGLMGVVNRKRWMGGNGETIDLMETMDLLNQLEAGLAAAANNPNYVPADSWNGANGEGIKTELSEAAVAAIGTSVKGAVSGIKVIMDGVSVGHLVAPTVSQDIARETAVP